MVDSSPTWLISILAPVRRRRTQLTMKYGIHQYFNSRPREETSGTAPTTTTTGGINISILAPVRRRQQKRTINFKYTYLYSCTMHSNHSQRAVYTTILCFIFVFSCADLPKKYVWEISARYNYKISGSPVSTRDFLPITSILF